MCPQPGSNNKKIFWAQRLWKWFITVWRCGMMISSFLFSPGHVPSERVATALSGARKVALTYGMEQLMETLFPLMERIFCPRQLALPGPGSQVIACLWKGAPFLLGHMSPLMILRLCLHNKGGLWCSLPLLRIDSSSLASLSIFFFMMHRYIFRKHGSNQQIIQLQSNSTLKAWEKRLWKS